MEEACPHQRKVFTTSNEAANTRTFLIIEGDLDLDPAHRQVHQQQSVSACTEDLDAMSSQGVLKDKKPSGPVDAIG